jgi:DnaK suppressor protein
VVAGKANMKTATASADPRRPVRPGRGRPALTRKDLARFRAMLLEKRRSLLGDLNGLAAEMADSAARQSGRAVSSISDHPADFGSDCHEMEMTVGLLASERALLQEIDEALDRIDDGTYGICLATGQPIGKARLKARPWAKYCIEHAREMEHRSAAARGYARRADEGMRISEGAADAEADESRTRISALKFEAE